ncbi:hypothetical protein DFP72DRAFT_1040388 [Ephemerocybe angulata]|uniref:Ankyrin repeat domain-containing protein n=1 Tax=Ephemerocybe angulata TaxID=980116 RepID=A0A8H6IFM1_9AGAR|nr:hypothetical protein DFP72DRAFT_1040388 [Tulosesus angulatus]
MWAWAWPGLVILGLAWPGLGFEAQALTTLGSFSPRLGSTYWWHKSIFGWGPGIMAHKGCFHNSKPSLRDLWYERSCVCAVWNNKRGAVKLLLAASGIDVNAADTSGWTALTWAAFNGREDIVQVLCAVPEIIVDVADVKHHIQNPPGGSRWGYAASKDERDKCVRILEEFVQSKGGGGQNGSEGLGGG